MVLTWLLWKEHKDRYVARSKNTRTDRANAVAIASRLYFLNIAQLNQILAQAKTTVFRTRQM